MVGLLQKESPHKKRIFYSLLEKIAGIVSAGIITVSNYDCQLAIQNKIISPEKIKMIHNGVPDITKLKQVSQNNKQIQLIMIARFAEPKNHRILVEVLSRLDTQDWNIHFVGEGPLKKRNRTRGERKKFIQSGYFFRKPG